MYDLTFTYQCFQNSAFILLLLQISLLSNDFTNSFLYACLISVSKINQSRRSWPLVSLSCLLWERSPNCAPKEHAVWQLFTQCQFMWTCIWKDAQSKNGWWQVVLELVPCQAQRKKNDKSPVNSNFYLLTLTLGSQTSQQSNSETLTMATCCLSRFSVPFEQLFSLRRKEKKLVILPVFSVANYNISFMYFLGIHNIVLMRKVTQLF